MIAVGARSGRPIAVAPFAAAGLVALLSAAVATERYVSVAATAALAGAALLVGQRTLLSWRTLSIALAATVLFIPAKRYEFPAQLPFHLEPYRLLILVLACGWCASLLVDPHVRARRTGLEAPIALLAVAVVASEAANRTRVDALSAEVNKALLLFASFFIVLFLLVSVLRTQADVQAFLASLGGGGAIVSLFAVVEWRTGYNVFNHLDHLPFLRRTSVPQIPLRSGRLRVYASSQHPIALAAALAMLVPVTVHLARTTGRRMWWAAAALLVLGAFATGSRTAVVTLAVVALVYLWLRPRQVRRFWPALIPLLAVIHFAMPGALGTLRDAFSPPGGLVAQQQDAGVGHARLSTLGPALHDEFRPHPFAGEGFGTRVTAADTEVTAPNAPILDDQWLGILLETGVAGVAAFGWLIVRFVRRTTRVARRSSGPAAELAVALTAAVVAYAVGMFLYDAFTFVQTTLVFFFLLAAGCASLANGGDRGR